MREISVPFIRKVSLVTHKCDDDLVSTLSTHILDPFGRRLERLAVGHIVHDNSNRRVANIRRN